MDVLTDIMTLLKIKSGLFGRLEFSGPFGFKFTGGTGKCLIVIRGSCYLGADKQAVVPLVGGDFVLLPNPDFYSLRSSPEQRLRSVLEITSEEEFHRTRLISFNGGSGPVTTLVAGCFTFASPESELLVKHLPPIIHLQGSENNASPWLQPTLQFIASETSQNLPGGTAIVDRLAEVLFVQAMRSRMDLTCPSTNPSWLRALSDPQIGAALNQMHADLGRAWTVAGLARNVSMSRSSFAERFRALVGETPLDHLTQWRMVTAASMMRTARPMKLAAIASAVGYESESSFGKVFRRVMGTSPGKYKVDALVEDPPSVRSLKATVTPNGAPNSCAIPTRGL